MVKTQSPANSANSELAQETALASGLTQQTVRAQGTLSEAITVNEAPPTRPLPWRELGVIAIAVATFMMAAALLLPPRYVTVDDSFLDTIASGVAIAGQPESHIPYMNFLVGILLSSLYKLTDKVPFYPIFLLAGQYIANVVICGTMWTIYRSRIGLIPIALYLFSIATPVLTIFQFSTTSAIIGIAGGVLAGAAFETDDRSRRNITIAAAVGLFVLSILTRPRMGIIVIASFFVVMVSKYAFVRSKKLIAVTLLTAGLLAVQFGLSAANDMYYSGRWSEFGKMVNSMYPIFDWGRANAPDNKAQLDAVGWSRNDYMMMRRGVVFDNKIFSSTTFTKLSSVCPPYRGDWKTQVPINLAAMKGDAVVSMVLILALASGLMLNLKQISPQRIVALVIGTIALTFAIAFLFKLARHAYLPMFYILAVVALTHLDMHLVKTIPVRSWASRCLTIFLCFIFCYIFVNFYNVEMAYSRADQRAEKRFDGLLSYLHANPDKLVFSLHATGILPPQIGSPFHTNEALRNVKLVTSFSSHAPIGQDIMRANGATDFASGLLAPNSVLLSDRRSNRLLKKYFSEHHNLKVRFISLHVEQNSGLGVYKVAVSN